MSTCAGRRDYLNIYFWYFSPCAPNGCSSSPFLNNPSLFWRCLCHRHVFLTHLNMIYPPFMYFFVGPVALFVRVHPTALRVCVCSGKWAGHKVAILPLFLTMCDNSVDYVAHRQNLPCPSIVLIVRYTISRAAYGREWRSVPLLQWRRGCCFFSGPETARYARWCNTYKGVFSPIFSWRSRRLSHVFLMGMLLSSSFLYIL